MAKAPREDKDSDGDVFDLTFGPSDKEKRKKEALAEQQKAQQKAP